MTLTVIVLTRNSAKIIQRCISSIKNIADEIIVVDDDSTDGTIVVAKREGAKVFRRKLSANLSSQKNFALQKAKGRWVFFLDHDEVVSKLLAAEINQIVNDPTLNYNGLYVRRIDTFKGKNIKHGEAGNIKLLRIAKKGSGRWERKVHEYWNVEGEKYLLKNPLNHYPHISIREFIQSINFYSEIHSNENEREKKKSSLIKIIFWPLGKFVRNYIFKLGFLDGVHGFIYAMTMSFHSFLSWSRLWLKRRRKQNDLRS